jgi:hypothetical protein
LDLARGHGEQLADEVEVQRREGEQVRRAEQVVDLGVLDEDAA